MSGETFPYKGSIANLYHEVVSLASKRPMWTTERCRPQRFFAMTLGAKAKNGKDIVFPDWLLARLPFKPLPPKDSVVKSPENYVWLHVDLEERERPGSPRRRIIDGVLAQINFEVNRCTKLEPTPGVEYQLVGDRGADLALIYKDYRRETTYHAEPDGRVDKIYQGPMDRIHGPHTAGAREAQRIGSFLKSITYID